MRLGDTWFGSSPRIYQAPWLSRPGCRNPLGLTLHAFKNQKAAIAIEYYSLEHQDYFKQPTATPKTP